jgi:hypothetical protein
MWPEIEDTLVSRNLRRSVLVLAVAYWFLGPTFIGSVALTGGIICGAGVLIGAALTIFKDKSY